MWYFIVLTVIFCTLQSAQSAKLPTHGQHHEPEIRIVNGTTAQPHSAPFVVLLYVENARGDASLCGGSLISERDVLTAAHCIRGMSKANVTLGVHDRTVAEPTQQLFQVTSSAFTVHAEADVGLIKLPQNATLNDNVKIISLPALADEKKEFDGEEATFYGWGLTNNSRASIARYLQQAEGPITKVAGSKWGFSTSTTAFIRRGCSGDSGGPLVLNSSGIQVGVDSSSYKPCESISPTFFERTSLLLQWIKDNSDAKIN